MTNARIENGALALPYPPSELSPNARVGWREKARYVKEYRWACNILCREWRPRGEPVNALSIAFVVKDNRRRDLDNLISSFKFGMDGLRDAGLISDDNWQDLTVSYSVEIGQPGVKVSVL